MRLRETLSHDKTNRTAKVYRNIDWNEYVVRFYCDGKHLPDADYHTDDKDDAKVTARFWVLPYQQSSDFGEG